MIYHGPTAHGEPMRYWLRPWMTLGEFFARRMEHEAFNRLTGGG